MNERALVLGGGGSAAIAWEIGVITGLADAGIDLRTADRFVGTSAGAIVAVHITSGAAIEDLYGRQADPQLQLRESAPRVDFIRWRTELVQARTAAADATAFLRHLGSLEALVPAPARRARMESRLQVQEWPAHDVRIAVVDADSGERRIFDRGSGAPLVDAVLASSAVAGIWPAVSIDGRRYIDGGFYSTDNADVAAGCDRVLILALPARAPAISAVSLDQAVEALRSGGARVEVVHPDAATIAAFASVGGNLLDPAVRESAAIAGRAQGRAVAPQVAALWT